MMNKKPLHICSFCGSKVFQMQEDIILKFPRYLAVIEEAAIGKCDGCGEHYHLPETSLRIEQKLEKLLQEKKISKKEQMKVEILYASEIPIQEALLNKTIPKRVEALEVAIGISG